MTRTRWIWRRGLAAPLTFLALLAAAVGLTACGGDDGADVRAQDATTTTGTGGLANADLTRTTDDPLVVEGVAGYRVYVQAEIDSMRERTTEFTDAIRAGELARAQDLYAPSRVSWERIEPIAGLIEDIDVAVDARVDDFAGVDDPDFTGWHRLEYILFEERTTEGAAPFADRLDTDLEALDTQFADLELPPAAVALGASELIEEVSEGKITGEEDRYSKTDLWDFNANVEGAEAVIEELSPALEARDPELLDSIGGGFAELNETLAQFRDGDGWVLYCQEDDPFPSERCGGEVTVTPAQVDELKAQLASLSEDLALVPGTLGLQ